MKVQGEAGKVKPLLPCPFCGGNAELREGYGLFAVWCVSKPTRCAVSPRTYWRSSVMEVERIWNRRARP